VQNKSDLDDFLTEELADPEARAQFEEIAPLVDFGCAVSIAREQRRMSVQALATATGIDRSILEQIEKGNEAPTLAAQTKIARALNARLEISPSGRIDFVLFPQIMARRAPLRSAVAKSA
jgi:ribosome-binding protein aMBF1 (putative translation factor)